MSVKHRFTSAKSDGGDTSLVRPSNWNDTHAVTDNFLMSSKSSADTPDDEFDSTSMDGKWTVVAGSTGTVDLFETTSVRKYDLSSRPGWLLMQGITNANTIELRQSYTLPDGKSIVMPVASKPSQSGTTQNSGDNQAIMLAVGDNDSISSGNLFGMSLEQDTTSWELNTLTDALALKTDQNIESNGETLIFRIARVGLVYHAMWSFDGLTWNPVDTSTEGSALTRLWIWYRPPSTATRAPICAIPWIRLGDNTLDPWPWT